MAENSWRARQRNDYPSVPWLHAAFEPANLSVVDRLAATIGGLFEQGVKEIAMRLREFATAAVHDGCCSREHLPQVEALPHRAVIDFAERGNDRRQQRSRRQQVAKRANDAARVEQGAHAGLGVVADVRADLRPPRRKTLAVDGDVDGAVIVTEIARLRGSAEIDPFADVRMAQKSFVILVAVGVNDARFDLAADPAARTDAAAAAQLRAEDAAFRPDVARTFQPAE